MLCIATTASSQRKWSLTARALQLSCATLPCAALCCGSVRGFGPAACQPEPYRLLSHAPVRSPLSQRMDLEPRPEAEIVAVEECCLEWMRLLPVLLPAPAGSGAGVCGGSAAAAGEAPVLLGAGALFRAGDVAGAHWAVLGGDALVSHRGSGWHGCGSCSMHTQWHESRTRKLCSGPRLVKRAAPNTHPLSQPPLLHAAPASSTPLTPIPLAPAAFAAGAPCAAAVLLSYLTYEFFGPEERSLVMSAANSLAHAAAAAAPGLAFVTLLPLAEGQQGGSALAPAVRVLLFAALEPEQVRAVCMISMIGGDCVGIWWVWMGPDVVGWGGEACCRSQRPLPLSNLIHMGHMHASAACRTRACQQLRSCAQSRVPPSLCPAIIHMLSGPCPLLSSVTNLLLSVHTPTPSNPNPALHPPYSGDSLSGSGLRRLCPADHGGAEPREPGRRPALPLQARAGPEGGWASTGWESTVGLSEVCLQTQAAVPRAGPRLQMATWLEGWLPSRLHSSLFDPGARAALLPSTQGTDGGRGGIEDREALSYPPAALCPAGEPQRQCRPGPARVPGAQERRTEVQGRLGAGQLPGRGVGAAAAGRGPAQGAACCAGGAAAPAEHAVAGSGALTFYMHGWRLARELLSELQHAVRQYLLAVCPAKKFINTLLEPHVLLLIFLPPATPACRAAGQPSGRSPSCGNSPASGATSPRCCQPRLLPLPAHSCAPAQVGRLGVVLQDA